MTMSELPIISIKDLQSDDQCTVEKSLAQLSYACREIGFFYLTDHGFSEKELSKLFQCVKRFFELPIKEKQALSIKRSQHNRGYSGMDDEVLNPESGADHKEAFNIGVDLPDSHPDVLAGLPFRGVNFWPDLPNIKSLMLNYFDHCLEVGRIIHRAFSQDLGLPKNFFDKHLTSPIPTLRILRYPIFNKQLGKPRADAGAGEHTDYGNITLLATDGVPGLEVKNRKGQWVDAESIPNALICNIGDCLMRWSNDVYLSTPHRVRAPDQERYSIVFFLEVNPDSIVDPLDIFPSQQPKYDPISCSDYLTERLNATYDYRNT